MGTALRKAEAAGWGEMVTCQGVEVDPRYRFRMSTVLDWLNIESDEQRSMRMLFGPEERARRWSAHQAARGLNGLSGTAEGLLFHMLGRWQLILDVRGAAGREKPMAETVPE